MNINFDEYLDDERIKEIVNDEVRDQVKKHLNTEDDMKRIVSNMAYSTVYKLVDETFDESLSSILTAKVSEIVSNLSESSIFKEPNAWSREPNHPHKVLQKAIADNTQKIKDVVAEQIPELTRTRLKENLSEHIRKAISETLFEEGDGL